MDVKGKIVFLDRKLEHDRRTIRVSLLWMVSVVLLAVFGGLLLNYFLPDFDGKPFLSLVAPGAFGLSLPAPIKEYFARRQSMLAIGWMIEQYRALSRQPDPELSSLLDQHFKSLFDSMVAA